MHDELRTTIRFTSQAYQAMRLEGSRNKTDIFADRMAKACTAPTLARAMEDLLKGVNADIPLPLRKWECAGTWGWHASALLPQGDEIESVQFYRKRFRQGRVDLTNGSPNLTNGVYRDWNQPLTLLMCREMVAFGNGDRYAVQRALRRGIKYLGKKRAHGRGSVLQIDVENIDKDFSFTRGGRAAKWFPVDGGSRLVRPRPPYWSNHGRVECCEIGELVDGQAWT